MAPRGGGCLRPRAPPEPVLRGAGDRAARRARCPRRRLQHPQRGLPAAASRARLRGDPAARVLHAHARAPRRPRRRAGADDLHLRRAAEHAVLRVERGLRARRRRRVRPQPPRGARAAGARDRRRAPPARLHPGVGRAVGPRARHRRAVHGLGERTPARAPRAGGLRAARPPLPLRDLRQRAPQPRRLRLVPRRRREVGPAGAQQGDPQHPPGPHALLRVAAARAGDGVGLRGGQRGVARLRAAGARRALPGRPPRAAGPPRRVPARRRRPLVEDADRRVALPARAPPARRRRPRAGGRRRAPRHPPGRRTPSRPTSSRRRSARTTSSGRWSGSRRRRRGWRPTRRGGC